MQTCCCPALHAPAGARSPDAQQGEQSDRHHGRGPQPVGEGGAGGQGLEDVKAHHTCTQQEEGGRERPGLRIGEAMHESKARGAAAHRRGMANVHCSGQQDSCKSGQGQQTGLPVSFGEAQGDICRHQAVQAHCQPPVHRQATRMWASKPPCRTCQQQQQRRELPPGNVGPPAAPPGGLAAAASLPAAPLAAVFVGPYLASQRVAAAAAVQAALGARGQWRPGRVGRGAGLHQQPLLLPAA